MVQSPVAGARWPVRMDLLLWEMLTSSLVKVAVQPWSHSTPMDRREPEASEGKMWAVVAEGGSPGRMRLAVCVEVRASPLGRRTLMPGDMGCLLVWGVCCVMKWPFAPVSATTGWDGDWREGLDGGYEDETRAGRK